MANTKSAQKNIRKTERNTEHNKQIRSRLKTLAKKAQSAAKTDAAQKAAVEYISALDKAAKTGIIHPNKASRHKSKLAKVAYAKA